ncbi:putative copper resistance protein D [Pseudonocardia hierapolitana]|uniref:Putative copper resistance protein D n=1 Tax=Pseudonocardia hierapolitana TaxID=1128676 RepID=A0A561SM57_9PSEU|nr:CopD family protein [Pseudonocardia hierapolitana]TWF75944.1 putative copper resistance protein D [Pseudonocardia hierapolitana]
MLTRPTSAAVAARPREAVGPAGRWAAVALGAAVVGVLLAATADGVLPGTTAIAVTVSRTVMDVAGVAVVGIALLEVLLPPGDRRAAPVLAATRRTALAAAGAWLVAVLLTIVLGAAAAFARPVTGVGADELATWVTRLGAGQGMLLVACATALVLGCTVVRVRRPALVPARVVLAVALFAMITPAVTGHSGAVHAYQVVAVVGVGVHVAAAAAWVGGLGAILVLVARRGLLVAVLPRFSRLAAVCIAAVAVTGVLTAAVRLPPALAHVRWEAAVQLYLATGTGQLLVAKTAALGVIGWLGWLTRRRLAASRVPLLLWAGYEVTLMAVALGLAAALTQTGGGH